MKQFVTSKRDINVTWNRILEKAKIPKKGGKGARQERKGNTKETDSAKLGQGTTRTRIEKPPWTKGRREAACHFTESTSWPKNCTAVPRIADLLDRVSGLRNFTAIDLQWIQIQIADVRFISHSIGTPRFSEPEVLCSVHTNRLFDYQLSILTKAFGEPLSAPDSKRLHKYALADAFHHLVQVAKLSACKLWRPVFEPQSKLY